ncbi:variable surface protein [Plasmodium gonderi]|uniref:Variable surface protein n=1 Tax=Plasmodium gonderi TaxID=77519 RepID=A0A1Y1JQQ0_PLAGO|nr:variable surface protein [Plasmodium gonderi]GAW84550.1 variable surface protein [Plasmodium gonderi]
MRKSINYWVHLFPLFNDIIDNYKDAYGGAIWERACPTILNDSLIDESLKNSPNNKKICIQAMFYLSDISAIKNELLRETACIYFYYWICHNIQNISNVQDIKNNYDAFLKVFKANVKGHPTYICENQMDGIMDEDLAILKDINGMYKKYDRNNWSNMNYNKNDFYQAAIRTINKINEKIETKDTLSCETTKNTISQIPNSCKSSIFFPVIITMMYTKFGSWLDVVILRRTNEMNNISEEIKRMQGNDREISITRNIRHNILYNAQKF